MDTKFSKNLMKSTFTAELLRKYASLRSSVTLFLLGAAPTGIGLAERNKWGRSMGGLDKNILPDICIVNYRKKNRQLV